MSDISRRIVTTFQAHAGNVRAVMGDIRGGMSQLRRETREFARDQSMLNSQLRAFGTTTRYALAGGVIFGAVGGVGQLSQVQTQLGLMAAIGDLSSPEGKNLSMVGPLLNQTSREIRDASIRTLTPLTEMNSAVVNFLSSVQNVKRPEIIPMVEEIAKGARLSQVAAEDTTKAFTTMNTAFGRQTNLKNIQEMSAQWVEFTSKAPGGISAGPQTIQQLGQISTMYAPARGTSAQMFAHLLSVMRGGIPPSQAGRGLAFLMQTLAFPSRQVKDSKAALAEAGVTTETVPKLGPHGMLMAVLREAKKRGVKGNLGQVARLNDEEFADVSEGGPLGKEMGVGGEGLEYLGRVFHRIHALRTAVALLSRMNPAEGQATLQDDLTTMLIAQRQAGTDASELARRWGRLRSETKLPEAIRALEIMRFEIVSAFEPVLNWAAGKTPGIRGFVAENNKEVAFGGAAALGAWAISSKMRGRRAGIGRGLVGAQAVQDAIGGAQAGMLVNIGKGYSPQDSLYVTVVGQIFGGGRGVPPVVGGPTGGPHPRSTPNRSASRAKRLGRGVKAGGFAGLLAFTGYEASQMLRDEITGGNDLLDYLTSEHGGVEFPMGVAPIPGFGSRWGGGKPELSQKESRVMRALRKGNITKETAERRLRQIGTEEHLKKAGVNRVQGEVKVNVVVKDEKGKVKGTASVTADLFPGFRPKAPQTRGKDTTARGDNR